MDRFVYYTGTTNAADDPVKMGFVDESGEYLDIPMGATVATMVGASQSTSGVSGSVPAPSSGDQAKFLRGDGTWVSVQKAPVFFPSNAGFVDAANPTVAEIDAIVNGPTGQLQDWSDRLFYTNNSTTADVNTATHVFYSDIDRGVMLLQSPPTTPFNGVAAPNGYHDVGPVRHMWGVHTVTALSGHPLVFHTAFGGAPWHVNLQYDNDGDNVGVNDCSVQMSTATATQVDINPADASMAIGDKFYWYAIGPTPPRP